MILNGRVELDDPGAFPEGMRVRINPEVEQPLEEEAHRQIIREAYEEAKAGRGTDARTFLKQLALERGLPLEPGE